MLHDMTVSHPDARIRHIDEYIYIFSIWDEDGIFPDEIGVLFAIGTEHDKSLSVYMEWMLHRMHRVCIIRYTDLDEISFAELPVDIHISISCGIISELPCQIFIITLIVHHRHCIFPFYRLA